MGAQDTRARSATRRFVPGVVLAGLAAGVTGWVCTRLLHLVEWLAFGLTDGTLLQAVEAVDPWRRVVALLVAGVVGGVSWYLLYRSGRAPVRIADAVEGWRMPVGTTLWHALTQVVIVGLGASIGREVAPREAAAALSAWISDRLGLSPEDRRILVACGAGAGLAAVYSVPLSGAVFALEVFLVRLTPRAVWPALAVSGIAVLVAQGWERTAAFYTVPVLRSSLSLTVWALVMGPLIGALGHVFRRVVSSAEKSRPTDARLLWVMPLVFTGVGLVAVWVPSVLGNGQSTAQTAFDSLLGHPVGIGGMATVGFLGIALVGIAKLATTLATIRSGAWGGTLTPGIAMGVCLGALTGMAWSQAWPGSPVAAFVFIGAAAFLGTSMRAPFTALVLVMEFTHQGSTILVPTVLALGGAVAVSTLMERRWRTARIDAEDE